MFDQFEAEWQWYRCSITGCGAGPLRVRPAAQRASRWAVGFADSDWWLVHGLTPSCPQCGHELDPLAGTLYSALLLAGAAQLS